MKKNVLYAIIAILAVSNLIFIAGFSIMFFSHPFMETLKQSSFPFSEKMRGNMPMDEDHWRSKKISPGQPFAETHKSSYDFGEIDKKNGVVETVFEIENEGDGVLQIGEISTSCNCTSAKIDKKTVPGGEKANLTVSFDPNFHQEPKGRFKRSIFVKTSDPKNPEMRFDIFLDIIGN